MPGLEQLITPHYGLVIYAAKQMHRRLTEAGKTGVDLSELIQQGFVGLLEAGSKYDPDRNVPFAGFASPRIHGAIVDYLR